MVGRMSEERPARVRRASGVEGAGQILALVRDGRAQTISELAAAMDMARSTVVQRLDHLVAAGLVVSEPVDMTGPANGRGRPPSVLRFNGGSGVVLAAQVGMSGIRVAAMNLAGARLAEHLEPFPIEYGPTAVLDHLAGSLTDIVRSSGRRLSEVRGLGVGLPSAVELSTVQGIGPSGNESWEGFSLADRLGTIFHVPTLVDVDANMLALGEQRTAWPGVDVLLCVKVGTVIGCGTVVRGNVVAGAQGVAGNIGHIPVPGDRTPCPCGNFGCLDVVASGRALVERLRRKGLHVEDVAHVAALAREGNPEAAQAVRTAGRCIGEVLAYAVNLLNPGVIALWGYLADAETTLLAGIRESVYQRSLPSATHSLQLARATLGDSAGLVGAGMMVASEILSPDAVDEYLTTRARVT
jgi:predicted NBD/HSP70 family sugar kinase